MMGFAVLDAAPDPAGIGIVAAAVLIVIGAIGVLIAGLVIFLWYRKRSLRHLEVNFPNKDGPVSP
jgi:hypothetical protein